MLFDKYVCKMYIRNTELILQNKIWKICVLECANDALIRNQPWFAPLPSVLKRGPMKLEKKGKKGKNYMSIRKWEIREEIKQIIDPIFTIPQWQATHCSSPSVPSLGHSESTSTGAQTGRETQRKLIVIVHSQNKCTCVHVQSQVNSLVDLKGFKTWVFSSSKTACSEETHILN